MKKLLLASLTAGSLLLLVSCSKKENVLTAKKSTDLTTKKKLNSTPAAQVVITGTYNFVSAVTFGTTNSTIGVIGASKSNLASLEQRNHTTNNQGQEFKAVSVGGGYYNIINTNSGKALGPAYGQTTEGLPIVQYTLDGTNVFKWKISYQGYGVYRIKSALDTTKGMHVASASTADGAGIVLETFSGSGPNQAAGYFLINYTAYKDSVGTNFFRRTTGLVANDGDSSIPLSDGRSLWTMGDSYVNDYNNGTIPCLFNNRSVALLQPTNDFVWQHTTTLSNPPNFFRSNTAAGAFNWPEGGFQQGNTVYVYTLNLKDTSGGLGFTSAGPNVFSEMTFPAMTISGYHSIANTSNIGFATGFIKASDGFVYVYGQGVGFYQSFSMYVARFPQSNPHAAWKFYKGGDYTNAANWVTTSASAVAIGTSTSSATNVNYVNGKYVALSSTFSLQCSGPTNAARGIYAATATTPVGPFGTFNLIYTIDDTMSGYAPFYYGVVSHPQFTNTINELLITYAINGYSPCLPGCSGSENPDLVYRPRGVRVPLKLIDPSF